MKFETYRMKDLIEEISMGPFGSNIKVECFVERGIPVLNGSNLAGVALNDNSCRYITQEKADSLGKANAHKGDVVITHRGTLGQIVFIPQNSKYNRYVISQSQFRVKCNEKILPEYLVYYFHTREGQYKLLSNASQVGVPALARASTTFQYLELEIPSIKEQKIVVDVLETIRRKIMKNEAINDNLEQQAQAIFENTFPHTFDADASETLRKLITFTNGKKRPEISGKVPVYGGNGIFAYANRANAENCVIIGRVGAYCGNTFFCLGKCWISDNAIQAKSKDEKSQLFIYYLLRNAALPSRHIGTGQPLMTQGILNAIPVNIPSTKEINTFSSICEPMYKVITANNCENSRLVSLRDSLLPKLMSGEIDVSSVRI